MSRPFERGTSSPVERADERPLVLGGLHGVNVGHVRARTDIHHDGHIRAAPVVLVRHDMGNGRARRVQGQPVSLHQRNHRVEHHHGQIRLPVLQVRFFHQRG